MMASSQWTFLLVAGLLLWPRVTIAQQASFEPKVDLKESATDLAELDRQYRKKVDQFAKRLAEATTDEARLKLNRASWIYDDKFIDSIFAVEKKHRGSTGGLLALAFAMRLAQGHGDPDSPAAQGRERAITLLKEHYLGHEELDLCFERLPGGNVTFQAEGLCAAAVERSKHPHVQAAALVHGSRYLSALADLKARYPTLLDQLRRDPKTAQVEATAWLERHTRLLKDVDEQSSRAKARQWAQRVLQEHPDLEVVSRSPLQGSQIVVGRVPASGKAPKYADLAKAVLFELEHLAVGGTAPDFEGHDPKREPLKLSSLRGKVVVLMFSANWCGPCKEMYPKLREVRKKFAGEPVEVLSVMADEELATVKEAIEEGEITWRALWDGRNCPIAAQWNVRTFPTLYVLDKKGVIRERDSWGSLEEVIAKLLREKAD